MTQYQIIVEKIKKIQKSEVKIICVSKNQPDIDVLDIYNQGQRDFAENRVQELTRKKDIFPADVKWHMIGRLQTNKVKYIIDFIEYIHSVDRIELAQVIDERAKKINKVQKVLIQFNISKEQSKTGFFEDKAIEVFDDLLKFENLEIVGLMTMAAYSDDFEYIRSLFKKTKTLLSKLNEHYNLNMKELSMGMSHDYQVALYEDTTMLRIGSAFFDIE